jgi:hypothetical protein
VTLTGNVPGRQRKELMDRFRDEPACRVFLSTDAGGTGLNLQSADTVINLEPPWNPAVLEQRIARVHRLGQHRPVQVINLVTRDSIEERVLKTIALKKSLFDGVFTGTSDEVSFASLGQRAFLDTVRALLDGQPPTPMPAPPPPAPAPVVAVDPVQVLVQAGVQFLEALAAVLATRDGVQTVATPEVLERGAAALQAIARGLQGKKEG